MKMTMRLKVMALLLNLLGAPALLRATTPKGSITIDRISEIKYPTDQAWSPDGKTIAFLWDWAGKQDIFTVQAGSPPVALTDFPVSPDTLRSDITRFEWVSAEQVLLVKDGTLWSVNTMSRTPRRLPGFEGVAVFTMLHDKREILYVQKGQIWINTLDGKNGRQLTHLAADQRGDDGLGVGHAGRPVDDVQHQRISHVLDVGAQDAGGDVDVAVRPGVHADLRHQHEENDEAHDDVDERRHVDAAFSNRGHALASHGLLSLVTTERPGRGWAEPAFAATAAMAPAPAAAWRRGASRPRPVGPRPA